MDKLKKSLTQKEFNLRQQAFDKVERTIRNAPKSGIKAEQFTKKSYFSNSLNRAIRVDLEICAGIAFVN